MRRTSRELEPGRVLPSPRASGKEELSRNDHALHKPTSVLRALPSPGERNQKPSTHNNNSSHTPFVRPQAESSRTPLMGD